MERNSLGTVAIGLCFRSAKDPHPRAGVGGERRLPLLQQRVGTVLMEQRGEEPVALDEAHVVGRVPVCRRLLGEEPVEQVGAQGCATPSQIARPSPTPRRRASSDPSTRIIDAPLTKSTVAAIPTAAGTWSTDARPKIPPPMSVNQKADEKRRESIAHSLPVACGGRSTSRRDRIAWCCEAPP